MSNFDTAYLGAGCFWGVEELFSRLDGVGEVISGYTGGALDNPTYEDICTGASGHAEVVKIDFDKSIISFTELLNYFWRLHDPTTLNRQGPDLGSQYRSAIFYISSEQKALAQKSINGLDLSNKWPDPVVTSVEPLDTFYPAEDYHQDYYQKKYNGSVGPICHYLRD